MGLAGDGIGLNYHFDLFKQVFADRKQQEEKNQWIGHLEQYVGRLNRDYQGKEEVIVYDYIDAHVPVFDKMYLKRLETYKKIGFRVVSDAVEKTQDVNAI